MELKLEVIMVSLGSQYCGIGPVAEMLPQKSPVFPKYSGNTNASLGRDF